MADERKSWWERHGTQVVNAVVALVATLLGAVLGIQIAPPQLVEVEKIVHAPRPVEPPDELFVPTTGWVRDPDEIEKNLDATKTLHFAQTPAGRAVLGDDDAYLWRAVRKAAKKPEPWYPNINQGSVGSCVGAGFKHGADISQATAISAGAQFEWKPISAEVIYAGSRVEVGGGRISGDGSIGAWAAKWVRERGGMVPMEIHGAHDLTQYSATRARQWGRSGVPDELEPLAKSHPIKGCALVTTAAEAKRSIQQGYPIAICSNQGFRMARDATGRCRPQGSWAHCMALAGYRSDKNGVSEGFYVLNSWGDSAHTGPVWPPDMPVAGFWADYSIVDRMLREGDSFALADVAGFPARKPSPDWFIHRRAVPARDLFTFNRSETALSW